MRINLSGYLDIHPWAETPQPIEFSLSPSPLLIDYMKKGKSQTQMVFQLVLVMGIVAAIYYLSQLHSLQYSKNRSFALRKLLMMGIKEPESSLYQSELSREYR